MPPKSSALPEWHGVSGEGFAFANGDFYAESSGGKRHRRATAAELKEHFKSGSDKDHPAHWFEAQLIHYGLQPSKTKAVARMRLFDAMNGVGKLAVPEHIVKLEGKLKKEWTKQDREAKKALKLVGVEAKKSTTVGRKRKADVSDGSSNPTKRPAAKTAKAATHNEASPIAPRLKQTARRGTLSQGPNRGASSVSPPSVVTARPIFSRHARRGGASAAPDRMSASAPSPNFDFHEEIDVDGPDASLAPLGLLNGIYDVSSPRVTSEWPFCGSNFDVALRLAGTNLWGRFDLGIVEGVMYFAKRPWKSSIERVPFKWRGREREGPIIYGNENNGWMKFLGHGRVEGYLDYMHLTFQAQHIPGVDAGIDSSSLKSEWDQFSEEKYDQENRARW